MLKFTEQQASVVQFNGDDAVVKSGAGTGKTTLLKGYAKANPGTRMLYLCYNKAIQTEAETSFPKNVVCRTMHAIAFAICGKPFAHKLGNLRLTDVKNFLKAPTWEIATQSLQVLESFLVSASVKIGPEHATFLPVFTERQRARSDLLVNNAQLLWKATTDPQSTLTTPHDVYLKLYCLREPEMHTWFGAILLDEAQDTNPVVSDFVFRQKCKRIIVGDDHQQLYRWRGAENSMDEFIRRQKASVFVVNKSFRFGERVAKIATTLLDYKSQITGCDPFPVYGNEKIDDKIFNELPTKLAQQPYTKLHRTVTGTLKTALSNISRRIYWVGGIDNYNIQEVLDVYYLSIKETKQVKRKKLLAEYRSYSEYQEVAQEVQDIEMLRIIKLIDEHEDTLPRKVALLRKNEIKDEVMADITISTAHRAKGLEWDVVVVEEDFVDLLDPELDKDEDEIADELNLLYVACTRAMKCLQPNELVLAIYRLVHKVPVVDILHNEPAQEAKPTSVPEKMQRREGPGNTSPQRVRLTDNPQG